MAAGTARGSSLHLPESITRHVGTPAGVRADIVPAVDRSFAWAAFRRSCPVPPIQVPDPSYRRRAPAMLAFT